MMHQHGSLMPPLLGDVFCQCKSGDAHRGVDPGGGPPSAPRQPVDSDPAPSVHPCDICGGPEQEHRLKVLFQVLDVNGDGGICVNDLTIGLKKLGVHRTEHELMKIVKAGDKDLDGQLDFEEFVHYLRDHEKKLRLVFKSLDKKNDGRIDSQEIMQSLRDLGVNISEEQAEKILKSMDKNGTMTIDWNEWRDYHLLHPADNIPEIILYWKHSTIFDVGESLLVPDEFTAEEKKTGMWWRHLVAGGGAGHRHHRPPPPRCCPQISCSSTVRPWPFSTSSTATCSPREATRTAFYIHVTVELLYRLTEHTQLESVKLTYTAVHTVVICSVCVFPYSRIEQAAEHLYQTQYTTAHWSFSSSFRKHYTDTVTDKYYMRAGEEGNALA